jgi:hypothetical protein
MWRKSSETKISAASLFLNFEEEMQAMMLKRKHTQSSKLSLVAAVLICVTSGVAALAQADFNNMSLSRVESELRSQVQVLSKHSEPWAKSVSGRAEFALYKIHNAQLSSNPSVENMHLDHACQALTDERALLVEAQLADAGDPKFLESLIEQTFTHREILGCQE